MSCSRPTRNESRLQLPPLPAPPPPLPFPAPQASVNCFVPSGKVGQREISEAQVADLLPRSSAVFAYDSRRKWSWSCCWSWSWSGCSCNSAWFVFFFRVCFVARRGVQNVQRAFLTFFPTLTALLLPESLGLATGLASLPSLSLSHSMQNSLLSTCANNNNVAHCLLDF